MPKTTSIVQAVEQDVHTTDTVARHKLGDMAITADGRIYRYAKNAGTALDAGKLCVAATPVANHENLAVAAAASVNAEEVSVTLGATGITSGDYDGGYMVVNDAAGEGIAYKIKHIGTTAASAAATVELEDPIKVALTTSSEVSFYKNLYDSVVISATDQADVAVGVPNVAVAANAYFWLQTGGVCAVLADEIIAQGAQCTIGTGVAGAVEAQDLIAEPVVGVALTATVDTEYRPIRLTLD